MKKSRLMTAFVIALCLALSVCCALADQTLEGDANVDQRNYPSTAPFIHPPFYNVKLTAAPVLSRKATRNSGPARISLTLTPP